MTEQIAKHCLKVIICEEVCEECEVYGQTGTDHCEADAVRMAIKALEEIQQYRATGLTPQMVNDTIKARNVAQKQAIENAHIVDDYSAIGTVEECRAAREKQIPKKPLKAYNDDVDLHWCSCPVCLIGLCWEDRPHPTYCPGCGQKLDWSE